MSTKPLISISGLGHEVCIVRDEAIGRELAASLRETVAVNDFPAVLAEGRVWCITVVNVYFIGCARSIAARIAKARGLNPRYASAGASLLRPTE